MLELELEQWEALEKRGPGWKNIVSLAAIPQLKMTRQKKTHSKYYNIPEVYLSTSPLTSKDRRGLVNIIKNQPGWLVNIIKYICGATY